MLSTNLFAAASPAAATAAATTVAPEATPSGFLGLTNPFLTSLQSNPFFEELIADIALNSPSPAPSLPSASRASPTPLASLGKVLPEPEWDDTFSAFTASRLHPEARSEILTPAGEGLERTELQDPGPGAKRVKAAEPLGDPGGGERGGSSVWLEPRVPLDLGLDQQSMSAADPGPLGSVGAGVPSTSALLHPRASDSEADMEPTVPGGEAGQSPADSATSLFSSPEVISVWERLPGPDDAPEGQDEATQGESQLLQELNTVNSSWPWDVVTISPAAETSSPVIRGESDEVHPWVQPESPEPVSPKGNQGLPPLELGPELKPEWVLDERLQSSMPPPKPPRLFTPSDFQDKEKEEEEEEKAAGVLSSRGAETGEEDIIPTALVAGSQEAKEEGKKLGSESDSCSSGTLLDEPSLEERAEDGSPPVSGSCLSLPTSCPEGPASIPCYSKSLALQSQQIWGSPEREGPEAPEAQSQGPVGEGLGPLPGSSQQAGLWVLEGDTLNTLSQGSRDPPSLPSSSPSGSRESSIRSGPEELPTPPEPAFPPPPLPPWASHRHGGPSPLCSPLPGAWPLTSSSPPPGEPASPAGGSPAPRGEDHAAATPASPLVLLPLETRPAEEPQPSAR